MAFINGKKILEKVLVVEKTTPVAAKLQSGKTASAGLSSKVIYADDGYDGLADITINPIGLDNLEIDLNLASGNQIVFTQDGYYADQVTIKKPATLLAGNIKKGVNIAGVTGTYEVSSGYPAFTLILKVSDFVIYDGEVILEYLINNGENGEVWQTIDGIDTIEVHDVYAIKFKITATSNYSSTNRIVTISNGTNNLVDIMQLQAPNEFTMESANFAILEDTTLTIDVSQS